MLLSDHDINQLGLKFDVNVLEEASYILWHIWKEKHRQYESLPACIDALTEDAELYEALKLAHRQKKYDAIRVWVEHPDACITKDNEIESVISAFLADLQPAMTRLVAGEIVLPFWRPEAAGMHQEVVDHLTNLRIPCLKGRPNLLLHELGSFKSDDILQKRLNNIFMPNSHTFLVNTSGSGKTRLLLEGLCENWGFYFTSLIDSSLLGSSDVQNAITNRVPGSRRFGHNLPPAGSAGYETALKINRQIASRVFRQIFLSRLFIFNLFAEIMNTYMRDAGLSEVGIFKQRWLFLQLQPSFIHSHVWDIFDDLSCKLSTASDAFINRRTKSLLSQVRTLCSEVPQVPFATAGVPQTPLFCVLDEAQHAATQLMSSFRSDHNGTHRPVLREIVRAWESQSAGQGVFMVVAGTGISKDVVDQAMASAIMKDSRYRWCSDTGAFDRIETQQRYLRKYLPSAYVESKPGLRLLERLWYWLHGRHRFTTGYVSELLLDGFKRPHALLNAYIRHFTQFHVTDAQAFVDDEGPGPLPVLSQYRLDFSKLKNNSDMLTTIHQLVTQYLMRSILPATLGKDEAIYVEYGFARFVDPETKIVAVDEPLVLLAATHWINVNHRTSYKYFAKQIHLHDPISNGFEDYIAFCIDMMFSKRRPINEVFTFIGTPPPWTAQEAELVALHRTTEGVVEQGSVRHFCFSGPSVTLGVNAKSTEETSGWLDYRSHSPFCFPLNSMGPDLMFVLRLQDGSLIWVAVQTKYTQGKNGCLTRPLLRKAMRSVTPSFFFVDKDGNRYSPASYPDLLEDTSSRLRALPNRRHDAGSCSLLRVIASFPADAKLKRCLEEDPDMEGHPIATLNMALVKQLTRKLSPVDFLQGLDSDPLRNGDKKRKRAVEASAPPRKRNKLKI